DSPRIAELEERIAELTTQRDDLLKQIPAEWEDTNKTFAALAKAEVNARRAYRRTADEAIAPVTELAEVLAGSEALAGLEGELRAIRADVETADPKALVERIEVLRSAMRDASAGKDTVKGLSNARKALRKNPDPAKAAEELDSSIAALAQDLSWRKSAQTEVLPGLNAYTAALADTIGLRSQPRMPSEQALYVAGCNAAHRDISLNF
ncbi:MAG: C4-dicarboxylate ABC transporter permease, partial [Planctomycetota bacterium]